MIRQQAFFNKDIGADGSAEPISIKGKRVEMSMKEQPFLFDIRVVF